MNLSGHRINTFETTFRRGRGRINRSFKGSRGNIHGSEPLKKRGLKRA
jgi:hypothetical protein